MDDPGSSRTLLAILLLVAANAFLVAAEFSLITLRRTRLEGFPRPGEADAARGIPSSHRLEELAFAAQLARSFVSVLTGWLAVRLGHAWLLPLWGEGASLRLLGIPLGSAATVAALLMVAAVAVLHATLGQQAPKLLGIHRPERIAALALPPLELLRRALWPVLWLLSFGVRAALRLFRVRPEGFGPLALPEDELRLLVAEGAGEGPMQPDEREMIRGVIEFRETVAREVMTPRTEMVAVSADAGLEELTTLALEEGHSRIPVYDGGVDAIVGVLLVKDLLPWIAQHDEAARAAFSLRGVMREPLFVPDTKPVNVLLAELRRHGVHLAIVVDEFGGTSGLVTMEDLLEEIVGEIRDEYDEAEPDFEPTPEGDVLIDGGTAIDEVNERFGLRLPEEDFDTIGGFVFGALGRLPVAGDTVAVVGAGEDVSLRVEATEERRVTLVRLTRGDGALPPAQSSAA